MTTAYFDAYFEGEIPVIIIDLDHNDPNYNDLMIELDNALVKSGMEKFKDNIYKQTRGGLNITLLKTKMRKLGFAPKRTAMMAESMRIPECQHFDYIHFVPGTYVDKIEGDFNKTFYFFKNGSKYNAYEIAYVDKLVNSDGKPFEIIMFWSAQWFSHPEKAFEKFASKYSIDVNDIKFTDRRFYSILRAVK